LINNKIFNNKHLKLICDFGIDNTNTIDFALIKLTLKQFLYFGIHLGHLQKNSEFLAA
jgi:hypothetical protein